MANEHFQHFNKPIVEVIKSRRSVRTYRPERLTEDIKNQLKKCSKNIKGPFKSKIRLELIDSLEILEKSRGKIGTYGVIKGAQDYIAAVVEKGENDLEQLGYTLEKLILFATSIRLGTCWLGGTFNKSEFAKLVELKENEILPIVTPIGYPGDRKSVVESLMRFAAGSNHRKPWNELFFDESLSKPLEESKAKEPAKALEAVRLAPSASNKQPWRILKEGTTYHFYLNSNKGYGKGLGFNIQRIDMGIAMCHFEMVMQELGFNGKWKAENIESSTNKIENLSYVVSWVKD